MKIFGRRIDLKDLPAPGFKPPWRELDGWGRMRRVLFWVAQVGQIGLLAAAMTSGSDNHITADGTKAKKNEKDESSVKENPHSAGVDADVKAKDDDNAADGSAPESKSSEEGAKPKVES